MIARFHPRRLKPAKVTTDDGAPDSQKRLKCQSRELPTRMSSAAPFDDFICFSLDRDLSASIHQDLVSEHGYQGSYQDVERYVRRIKEKELAAFIRLHAAPGEKARVDCQRGTDAEE